MMELEEDAFYITSYSPRSTELHNSFESSVDTPPTSSPSSSTLPPVSSLELEVKIEDSKPGNAFSQFHVFQDYERPGTSYTNSGSDSFLNFPERDQVVRKISSMDFPGRTAIPRPSTRSSDIGSPKSPLSDSFDYETHTPEIMQGHSLTDPSFTMENDTPDNEGLYAPGDGKKKSRFNMIKSKLSFKDLRKESSKLDLTKESTPPTQQTVSRAAIPTPSLAVYGKKTNSGRNVKISAPTIVPSTSARGEAANPQAPPPVTSQLPQPSSRIPLPPSGTLSNVQGTLSRSRRSSGMDSRAKDSPDFATIKDKLESAAGPPNRPQPRRPAKLVTSRSSSDTPCKKPLPKKPSTAHGQIAAKNFPTTNADPTFKQGNVKNLAKNFVEGQVTAPSEVQSKTILPTFHSKDESPSTSFSKRLPSDIQPKASLPTLHKKDENLATSLPQRLPSFQERLSKAGASNDQGKQLEGRRRTTSANSIDGIVDMVRSLQRQLEAGNTAMNQKFEDLSKWIGDELRNQIQSSSDLSRTNSDLFTKQCQISREMMKFQLDIRLEINALEQKLVSFENRVIDDLQNEIRSLARAFEELNHKQESVIEKYSIDDTQAFIDQQIQKNAEVDREVAYLKARQDNLVSHEIAPFAASQRVPTRRSLSTHGSHEPLIREIRSYENIQMESARANVIPSVENKPPTNLPRSVSISKKGLLKGIKDITSSTVDVTKEKSPETRKPSEETKKWNMFGLRRRRNHSEGSGKFNWASHTRHGKNTQSTADASSSRSSSPPIPPIPRNIVRSRNFPIPSFASEDMHPAFRDSGVDPLDQPTTTYDAAIEKKLPTRDLDYRTSDGSADAFGHMSSRLHAYGDRTRFTEELSPVFSEQPGLSPDTVVHCTLTNEGREQKDFNETAEQEWDHVYVEESKTEENIAN